MSMVEPKKVQKAIIPVAGLGTRMLPASKAVPKEMLPLLDKPIIQYIVEEAILGGIKEIIFVTRKGKEAIEKYFDDNFESDILKKTSKKITFSSIRQKKPLGLGHAILCAKKFIEEEEPFAIFLPDEFLFSEMGTKDFAHMMENHHFSKNGQILVEKVEMAEISNYGVINIGNKKLRTLTPEKIIDLIEKPSIKDAPSFYRIVGRYILPYEIFKVLKEIKPGKNNEIQLTDSLKKAVELKKIHLDAVLSDSKIFDCGSPKGFLGANTILASQNKDLKQYLKEILN